MLIKLQRAVANIEDYTSLAVGLSLAPAIALALYELGGMEAVALVMGLIFFVHQALLIMHRVMYLFTGLDFISAEDDEPGQPKHQPNHQYP